MLSAVMLFLLRNWRGTLFCVMAGFLIACLGIAATQRDHARAALATATAERDTALAVARQNAAATAELVVRHAVELAALTTQREADAARANALEIRLEALRRDPTHAAPAAAVLRDAIGRLRDARAAGAGAAAGAQPDPAAAAAAAQPASPAGAGQPDAGRRG